MGRVTFENLEVFEDMCQEKIYGVSARKEYVAWIDQKFVKLLDINRQCFRCGK